MIPNIVKGSDIKKLMWYLAGPGKHNEHRDQRVLAGDAVTMAVYRGPIDTARAWELGRLLDSPRQVLLSGEPVLSVSHKKARALMEQGVDRKAAYAAASSDENTWHCSLSLNAEEGTLEDATWERIANDFMREMGFADRDDDVPDTRWAGVHHGLSIKGNDHIHIAMARVRPDGSVADVFRDYPRAQAACRMLEERYGLRLLFSREWGDTERATKPAERARAQRTGAPETDREALRRRVRGAAVAAGSEGEWLRALRAEGIIVSPRWAAGGGEVEGYRVQLPARKNLETGAWERSITYGGLRLGKDLTLPSLRKWAPWDHSAAARADALEEWRRAGAGKTTNRPRSVDPLAQREAIDELRKFSDAARKIPVEDRSGWANLASQTSGLFAAASTRTETRPGPLDRLSRQLARAGQMPAHQRRPSPTRNVMPRAVARMLWAQTNPEAASMALVYALTELLLTVRETLAATDRAAASAAMASEARKALTEVHMRAAGIDPARPYDKSKGSPAWAAAMRASAVVDRLDPRAVEDQILDAQAMASARRDRGKPTRAQGPLTPPTGTSAGRGAERSTPDNPWRPPMRGPQPRGQQPPGQDRGRGHGR